MSIQDEKIKELLKRVESMQKQGLKCIEYIVRGKTEYLPFVDMLDKPCVITADNTLYLKRKQEKEEFELLRNYYLTKNKGQ